jgi:two-component system phosphate regulon sensor histidine kinase PhoR
MAFKLNKTYTFAAFTSGYITLIISGLLGVFLFFSETEPFVFLIPFALILYAIAFFIIQFRVQKFIYRRVKKIYDNVSLLDASSLGQQPITTNMESLTKEVERFAQNKKLEIEAFKIRENYRKEFIGNVSHELKTPLFTVQGYLETLLDGAINDEKVSKKYLQRANKGVDRLIYIVKDLDMITKLEVGDLNLNIENFNSIEIINNVFDLLEMKALKKRITLTFNKEYLEPILVEADKDKIQQVITNLIVNSIKYGKEDGTTEVSVESILQDKIIIRITDNGIGIKEKLLPRLFERFYRVDKSGARSDGGSCLGLSIVKHIIEAHNEKIYIESQIGVGSEFSFTLEKSK